MRVFISGFGNIGQGFAELLAAKKSYFQDNGYKVSVVGVMDSSSYDTSDSGLDVLELIDRKKKTKKVGTRSYTDAKEVLDSVDYDVIVEASPTDVKTGGAGLDIVQYALGSRKDVILVNKGPLALKFRELMDLAKDNGRLIRFEGTVGAAMPIINLCQRDLAGQEIRSIRGIFNGTCNYVLSKMDKGQPQEQALKEAQQLGYAETDPSYDIDGFDTACKIVILANAVFGRDVTINDVDITGISSITEEAVAMAASRNMVIRLIGEVSDTKLEVSPRLIPKGHPLSITGTRNKAEIITDFAGPVNVSGQGAGRLETASAILSDLISIMDARKE